MNVQFESRQTAVIGRDWKEALQEVRERMRKRNSKLEPEAVDGEQVKEKTQDKD